MLFIIKIAISIIAVTGIVFISERNSKIGGLVTGLPVGVGILMFFYALEQDTTFAISGIPYGIAGLTSTLAFGVGFYLGGKLFQQNKFLHAASSTCCGISVFFVSGFMISLVNINLPTGIGIFLVGMLLSLLFFTVVAKNRKIQPQQYSLAILVFRALFVASAVIVITGAAAVLGPKWAGIMASFPSTLCPVLIILAYNYNDEIYPNLLKHFSYGISNLVVYYISILLLYPAYGIYSGTFFAYLICLVYLYALNTIGKIVVSKRDTAAKVLVDNH